jgi:hypothetical protein
MAFADVIHFMKSPLPLADPHITLTRLSVQSSVAPLVHSGLISVNSGPGLGRAFNLARVD